MLNQFCQHSSLCWTLQVFTLHLTQTLAEVSRPLQAQLHDMTFTSPFKPATLLPCAARRALTMPVVCGSWLDAAASSDTHNATTQTLQHHAHKKALRQPGKLP